MARHLIKTDVTVRTTKPTEATLRLNDGDGLYLLVKPNGARWWRLDYSIGGKRKTLSIGVYPDTGLKAARNKADEARQLVAAGTDPSDVRKADKATSQGAGSRQAHCQWTASRGFIRGSSTGMVYQVFGRMGTLPRG